MPNAKVLAQKQQIVEDLKGKLSTAITGVVVDYKGISVADDTALRKELREAGVEYSVIKNTLAKRAFEENGYEKLFDDLNGMTAFATSANDQVIAAKILKKYADKVETFELKSGYVDGEVLDKAGIEALANIPAKEVLIGKILGSLQSSLYGLAFVLQAIVDKSGEAGTEEAPAEEPAAEETKEEAPASTEEPTA